MNKLTAAIAYFEDAVRESDEIIAECSPELQEQLTEQKQHFAVALESMRKAGEAAKVVLCEECNHCLIDLSDRKYHLCMRDRIRRRVSLEDFCSCGERAKADGERR